MRVMPSSAWLLLLLTVAASSSACGGDAIGPADELPPTAILTIDNQSHFPLEELRVHPSPDYRDSVNLLAEPLQHDSQLNLEIRNRSYVTVIRRRVDAGARVAFTTAWPVELEQDGFILIVFQESFRLVDPLATLGDGGPVGDGAPFGDATGGDSDPGDLSSGDSPGNGD